MSFTAVVGAVGAANAGVTVATNARKISVAAVRRLRLMGHFEPEWVSLEGVGGDEVSLSMDQLSDIRQFLASDRMRPVLILATQERDLGNSPVQSVNEGREHRNRESSGLYETVFLNEVKAWNANLGNRSWQDAAPGIWSEVTALMRRTIPSVFANGHEDVTAELECFDDFVIAPFLSHSTTSLAGLYQRDLSSLSVDIDRLIGACDRSERMAALQASQTVEPMITHTASGIDMQFDDLYVEREIVANDGRSLASLYDEGAVSRLVITGAPGAGKSTLAWRFHAGGASGWRKGALTWDNTACRGLYRPISGAPFQCGSLRGRTRV